MSEEEEGIGMMHLFYFIYFTYYEKNIYIYIGKKKKWTSFVFLNDKQRGKRWKQKDKKEGKVILEGKKLEGECRVEGGIDEVWKRARERVQSKMMFPRVLWVLGRGGGGEMITFFVGGSYMS